MRRLLESDVPLRPCNSGSGTGAAGPVRGARALCEHGTVPKRPAPQTPRPPPPPGGLAAEAIQTLRAMELIRLRKANRCDRMTMKLAIPAQMAPKISAQTPSCALCSGVSGVSPDTGKSRV